jgi:formylglycine-generating enzyme required for sulfatase activity
MDKMDGPYTRYARSTLWLLPAGDVPVGGEADDAQPAFEAEVSAFYISKVPITNEEYEVFRPDHGRAPEGAPDDAPAVQVTWEDAAAYCAWYAEFTGKAFRLPSELEWEYAARSESPGAYFFDGGADAADTFVRHAGNSPDGLPSVESRRANEHGLFDTLGTVWEWTASRYAPYPIAADDGRDDPDADGKRVLRGGSYLTPIEEIGCGVRRAEAREFAAPDLGFRIVRSL